MEIAAPARRAEEPPAGLRADRLLDRLMRVGWPPTSRGTRRRCSSCQSRPPPPRRRCGSKTTQPPVIPIRRPGADIRSLLPIRHRFRERGASASTGSSQLQNSCSRRRAVLARARKLLIGLEAPPGFEPGMEVLQTSALPLGDGAGRNSIGAGRVRPRLKGGYDSARTCRRCESFGATSPPSPFGLRRDNFRRGSGGGSWSGKRDSNPRLRPWQGRTLPLSYSRPRQNPSVPQRSPPIKTAGLRMTGNRPIYVDLRASVDGRRTRTSASTAD